MAFRRGCKPAYPKCRKCKKEGFVDTRRSGKHYCECGEPLMIVGFWSDEEMDEFFKGE